MPEKRTRAGIAQARLAVDVVRAFIRREIVAHGERVAEIAIDIAAVRVYLLHGIDPLHAAPLEEFRTTSALHKVRWPEVVAATEKKRDAVRRLAARPKRRAR